QLVGVAAADADLVRLPQPVLEIHARDWLYVQADNRAAQRRIGGRPRFGSALFHFAEDVVGQLPVTALDALHADVVRQLDGGAQSPQRGHVRTANALEAFGADLGIVPAFGGDRAPHAVDDFIAHVEETSTFGRHQPLVWARRIHVAAKLTDVKAHHSGDVRSIDGRQYSFCASESGEFLRGKHDS